MPIFDRAEMIMFDNLNQRIQRLCWKRKILYIIHIYIHIYITSLSIEIYLWCGTSSILDWASVLDVLKFRSCKKKHGEKSKIKEDKSPTKIFSLFEIKQNKNKQK